MKNPNKNLRQPLRVAAGMGVGHELINCEPPTLPLGWYPAPTLTAASTPEGAPPRAPLRGTYPSTAPLHTAHSASSASVRGWALGRGPFLFMGALQLPGPHLAPPHLAPPPPGLTWARPLLGVRPAPPLPPRPLPPGRAPPPWPAWWSHPPPAGAGFQGFRGAGVLQGAPSRQRAPSCHRPIRSSWHKRVQA
jgi:hypothetical protein